jgi:hypothetical protein
MKTTIATIAALSLAACAPSPDTITAAYVSPAMFNGQSCASLNAQSRVLAGRLATATGQQQAAADADSGTMALAIILFAPAVFFVGGNDQSDAIAQMRGEAEALQSAAAAQGCA